MNSLYWLIAGGLAAVVLIVLAVAIIDVLRTARRGRSSSVPRSSRPESTVTDVPASDITERSLGEGRTQPLYRRDRRWERRPEQ
jgi:hypothetical protein